MRLPHVEDVAHVRSMSPSFSSSMAKRHGDSTYGVNTKVKKRKGIKVRTVNVPDSDDEGHSRNVETERARLLKTRVTASGKADSVTMNSLPLFEVESVVHGGLEPTIDSNEEVMAENTIPVIATAKKRRKKMNDSVRSVLLITK